MTCARGFSKSVQVPLIDCSPTCFRPSTSAQAAGGVGNAIRCSIPIWAVANWSDSLPGYLEIDFVEHCGGVRVDGDLVHSLVLVGIETGWAECLAVPFRNHAFVIEHVGRGRPRFHFHCDDSTAATTLHSRTGRRSTSPRRGASSCRSGAYKKDDQAWVEQKNGSTVRRLVDEGKLRGLDYAETLASLYRISRLCINYFRPSFRLKSKTRHTKRYEARLTPLERILGSSTVPEAMKQDCAKNFARLILWWNSCAACMTRGDLSQSTELRVLRRQRGLGSRCDG